MACRSRQCGTCCTASCRLPSRHGTAHRRWLSGSGCIMRQRCAWHTVRCERPGPGGVCCPGACSLGARSHVKWRSHDPVAAELGIPAETVYVTRARDMYIFFI